MSAPTSGTPGNITMGRVEVSPSKLRSELDRIRREAAELDRKRSAENDLAKAAPDGASSEAAPRVHATLANLVLLLDKRSPGLTDPQIDGLLTHLCVSHPARFFIVSFVADAPDKLATAAASRCVLAASGVHICSEEVFIEVGAALAPAVPNLLLSLFVPDIECVLVLPGEVDPQGGFIELLTKLATMSSVVVCDSGTFGKLAPAQQNFGSDQFRLLASAMSGTPAAGFRSKPTLRDLNWYRVARWRDLLAEQFESIQWQVPSADISGVRLTVGGNKAVSPSASLFAAWIMARLGWSAACLTPENDKKIEYRFAERESAGLLVGIELCGADPKKPPYLSIQRDVAGNCVLVTTHAGNQHPRRIPFSEDSFEHLVSSGVGAQGIDSDFAATCRALVA